MPPEFRVIDTGLRSGRENIAFDQALIDGRLAANIPDTIRFLQFPPTCFQFSPAANAEWQEF